MTKERDDTRANCDFCDKEMDVEDMWWRETYDMYSVYCCPECAIKEGIDKGDGAEESGDWVRPIKK